MKIERASADATAAGGLMEVISRTILTGEITVTGSKLIRFITVDTEGAVPTDDLVTINGGNVGELAVIQAANSARTVVMKDGADLKLQGDFSLDNIEDKAFLVCVSSGVWHGLGKQSSGV